MTMTVVTPSHAPDFPSFARLHASVVRFTDPGVRHVVAVPDADIELFRSLKSARLDVRGYSAVLPRRFVSTTALARIPRLPRGFRIAAVNLRRPWPPIRGWMLQQVVKLAVVSELDTDVAVLIDSDVIVVRPLAERAFRNDDGVVRLYRQPHGIDEARERPLRWLRTARALVGAPQPEADGPDYISAFASWDPALVRACVERVAAQTRSDWRDVIGSRLDFSEFLLYGTYVMTLADPSRRQNVSADSLCHSHWDPVPLDRAAATRFADEIGPRDLAVHVQSNSGTGETIRDYISDRVSQVT
ncbi:DUF6492 family protein [Microbacterium memoriense]|uniref:DUF6492 family protein n=1 Tax=Microbacterium memoriense TaxID=2978350 RepID=A0ABT2PDQ4_9MICO|nr:DUF6492 family protein [Microbacterium memoriense]MCT9002636.1 DUF6492 family protein [Microbacterium memoriense]